MKTKTKQLKWWLFAVAAFLVFVVLQIPANWLIAKFSLNNGYLQNVSGNIWQGQADWQKGNLQGSLHWSTRPLDLLLLRLGAQVELHSANTQINAVVGYGLGKKVVVKNVTGQIAPETLKVLANWQWPDNKIQLNNVAFHFKPEQGFSDTSGQMNWGGGALLYSMDQRQERINVPSLLGEFSDNQGKLQLDISDQRSEKMAKLQLDPSMMLDVQLTQRFLLNSPSYEGKAGLDTYVLGSRQPLLQGGL